VKTAFIINAMLRQAQHDNSSRSPCVWDFFSNLLASLVVTDMNQVSKFLEWLIAVLITAISIFLNTLFYNPHSSKQAWLFNLKLNFHHFHDFFSLVVTTVRANVVWPSYIMTLRTITE